MNKKIEELTRAELEAVAADWKVDFTAETTDEELRKLITEAMDKAAPVTAEDLEKMSREELLAVAAGMGIEAKGNEATIRKQLKDVLMEPGAKDGNEDVSNEQPAKPTQKSIETWIAEKRIPSWQSAAVMQANKWAAGKKLTEEQFKKGLAALNKPMGR